MDLLPGLTTYLQYTEPSTWLNTLKDQQANRLFMHELELIVSKEASLENVYRKSNPAPPTPLQNVKLLERKETPEKTLQRRPNRIVIKGEASISEPRKYHLTFKKSGTETILSHLYVK